MADSMKNWNRTGKIKAIILGLSALPNLISPLGVQEPQGPGMILMPFLFGCIAIPVIAKFNGGILKREIARPNWNDNPLNLKRPLSFFHFGSFFFLTVGLSIVLGTGIKYQTLSFIGLTSISFGLGTLIGIWLTLKWTKPKVIVNPNIVIIQERVRLCLHKWTEDLTALKNKPDIIEIYFGMIEYEDAFGIYLQGHSWYDDHDSQLQEADWAPVDNFISLGSESQQFDRLELLEIYKQVVYEHVKKSKQHFKQFEIILVGLSNGKPERVK